MLYITHFQPPKPDLVCAVPQITLHHTGAVGGRWIPAATPQKMSGPTGTQVSLTPLNEQQQ
jgi:hypothetical protein